MAGVQADDRAVPERGHVDIRGAPIRHIGVVEGRLEELVLQHESLMWSDALVDRRQALSQSLLPAAEVSLSGVVRTVGQPNLEVTRTCLVHDLDALEVMIDRLAPHRLVDVGQAAELVEIFLEGVGVDGAELQTKISRVVPQGRVILNSIPRNMESHLRRQPSELMHLGRVGQLLMNGAGSPGSAEDLESGAGITEGPRREFDGLKGQLIFDGFKGGHEIASLDVVGGSRSPAVASGPRSNRDSTDLISSDTEPKSSMSSLWNDLRAL